MKKTLLEKLFDDLEAWSLKGETALPETQLPGLTSDEALQALAEVVMALFQQWKVHGVNQAALLGRPEIDDLINKGGLPRDKELLERIGHLMAISRGLKRLYPYAPTVRDHWVWRHHEALAKKTPMEVMLAEGLSGMRRVRALLEQQLEGGRPL
jgi:hypothetical protein